MLSDNELINLMEASESARVEFTASVWNGHRQSAGSIEGKWQPAA